MAKEKDKSFLKDDPLDTEKLLFINAFQLIIKKPSKC